MDCPRVLPVFVSNYLLRCNQHATQYNTKYNKNIRSCYYMFWSILAILRGYVLYILEGTEAMCRWLFSSSL